MMNRDSKGMLKFHSGTFKNPLNLQFYNLSGTGQNSFISFLGRDGTVFL